jgi:hypothetical protein
VLTRKYNPARAEREIFTRPGMNLESCLNTNIYYQLERLDFASQASTRLVYLNRFLPSASINGDGCRGNKVGKDSVKQDAEALPASPRTCFADSSSLLVILTVSPRCGLELTNIES